MNPSANLKPLLVIQLAVGILAAALGACWNLQLGASIGFGAFLMLFNLAVLGWTWQRLFHKKSIAWTSLLIVIKYAVLLSSISYLARTDGFDPLGAGLGIASFVVAVLVLAVVSGLKQTANS